MLSPWFGIFILFLSTNFSQIRSLITLLLNLKNLNNMGHGFLWLNVLKWFVPFLGQSLSVINTWLFSLVCNRYFLWLPEINIFCCCQTVCKIFFFVNSRKVIAMTCSGSLHLALLTPLKFVVIRMLCSCFHGNHNNSFPFSLWWTLSS